MGKQQTLLYEDLLPDYQYQPLTQADSIRLIVLRPSTRLKTRVKCSIIHTTFRECEKDTIDQYCALSYVWGDSKNPIPIIVDNHKFYVTKNLDSALRHLRDATRPRRIWVDAICIDQKNIPEKNAQVREMHKVYWNAQHTLIYLGDSTPKSDAFLSYLSLPQNLRGVIDEKTVSAGLEDLLERPWFFRVWILQEIAYSKSPWICCGQLATTWSELKREFPADFLTDSRFSRFYQMEEQRNSVLLDMNPILASTDIYVRQRLQERFVERLLRIMLARRGLGALDSRDLLFAHIHVAAYHQYPQESIADPKIFEPDYGKSKDRVFSELASDFYGEGTVQGGTSVLAAAERTTHFEERSDTLPSWVVDWGLSNFLAPFSLDRLMYNEDSLRWEAPIHPLTMFKRFPAILALRGCEIGKVQSVSTCFSASGEDRLRLAKLEKQWSDQSSGNNDDDDKLMSSLQSFIIALSPFKPKMYGAALIKSYQSNVFLKVLFDAALRKKGYMFNWLYLRRLATLENGRMALVPSITRPGDVVCFIGETTIPFVLRPELVEPDLQIAIEGSLPRFDSRRRWSSFSFSSVKVNIGHFKFVGQSFVDGVMHGAGEDGELLLWPEDARLWKKRVPKVPKRSPMERVQDKVFILH